MKLGIRMNHIVDMCYYADVIVDIGCDHGYISIELINRNKCKKCYAVDINHNPLLSAINNIEKHNLSDKIECILSNGFNAFDNLDGVGSVIAGMGGSTIVDILDSSSNKISRMNYILLQPNAYSKDIRKYIYEKNIYVEKEDIIYSDGVYYEYILILPKQQGFLTKEKRKILLEFNYEIPLCLLDNNCGKYNGFINFKIDKYKRIIQNIKNNSRVYEIKSDLIFRKIKLLEGFLR